MFFTPYIQGTSEDIWTIEWFFGDGGYYVQTDLQQVSYTYAEAGTYYVTVIATFRDGCRESYEIEATPGIEVPYVPLLNNLEFRGYDCGNGSNQNDQISFSDQVWSTGQKLWPSTYPQYIRPCTQHWLILAHQLSGCINQPSSLKTKINGNYANLSTQLTSLTGKPYIYGVEVQDGSGWAVRIWSRAFNPQGMIWQKNYALDTQYQDSTTNAGSQALARGIYLELVDPMFPSPAAQVDVIFEVEACNNVLSPQAIMSFI